MISVIFLVVLAAGVLGQKTPVDQATLSNLTRYAHFASAAYSSDCTIPPYGTTVVTYFDEASTDTQATLFRDDSAKEYILSYRGTSNLQDFLADNDQTLVACSQITGISCTTCNCFEGYLKQYVSVQETITANISAALAAKPGYSLTVTGHSLGGGLASLSATALKGQKFSLVSYTYGQPRTGDQAYADYVDSVFPLNSGPNGVDTMVRATHENDGVPQIPPTSDGYRHHSTEYWQSTDAVETASTYQCTGQEPADCNQSEPGYGIGDGVIGINAAHLEYFGIGTGNPVTPNTACEG